MCLVALSIEKAKDWKGKEAYFYTIIANRDEYHERPTGQMHWWADKEIIAGKDNEAGGAWLGFSKGGRFAALTNYKENTNQEFKLSRGLLVTQFLESNLSSKAYLESLDIENYAGFNLIVGDMTGLFYFCNRSEGIYFMPEGVHALGNLTLNADSPKIASVVRDLQELSLSKFDIDSALRMMRKEQGRLHEKTKIELKPKEATEIPYRFIKSNIYGTRCTTICRTLPSGDIDVCEQTYLEDGVKGSKKEFTFNIKNIIP
ncbi:MAG: hypothetical protein CMD53_03670 [Gammaproteobacteria bacterium]|jgi:uncharacterized protein with NRDE domain|nr:hypothetical protein [Gammaproteobacteria bacterium]HJM59704.1 NRDE family protein [SAR86 cluster bacterium]|tara:strand:+ start:8647 stop:9423 length:777 start_codon:yes stop_codon:yes gene_type:complete